MTICNITLSFSTFFLLRKWVVTYFPYLQKVGYSKLLLLYCRDPWREAVLDLECQVVRNSNIFALNLRIITKIHTTLMFSSAEDKQNYPHIFSMWKETLQRPKPSCLFSRLAKHYSLKSYWGLFSCCKVNGLLREN